MLQFFCLNDSCNRQAEDNAQMKNGIDQAAGHAQPHIRNMSSDENIGNVESDVDADRSKYCTITGFRKWVRRTSLLCLGLPGKCI